MEPVLSKGRAMLRNLISDNFHFMVFSYVESALKFSTLSLPEG